MTEEIKFNQSLIEAQLSVSFELSKCERQDFARFLIDEFELCKKGHNFQLQIKQTIVDEIVSKFKDNNKQQEKVEQDKDDIRAALNSRFFEFNEVVHLLIKYKYKKRRFFVTPYVSRYPNAPRDWDWWKQVLGLIAYQTTYTLEGLIIPGLAAPLVGVWLAIPLAVVSLSATTMVSYYCAGGFDYEKQFGFSPAGVRSKAQKAFYKSLKKITKTKSEEDLEEGKHKHGSSADIRSTEANRSSIIDPNRGEEVDLDYYWWKHLLQPSGWKYFAINFCLYLNFLTQVAAVGIMLDQLLYDDFPWWLNYLILLPVIGLIKGIDDALLRFLFIALKKYYDAKCVLEGLIPPFRDYHGAGLFTPLPDAKIIYLFIKLLAPSALVFFLWNVIEEWPEHFDLLVIIPWKIFPLIYKGIITNATLYFGYIFAKYNIGIYENKLPTVRKMYSELPAGSSFSNALQEEMVDNVSMQIVGSLSASIATLLMLLTFAKETTGLVSQYLWDIAASFIIFIVLNFALRFDAYKLKTIILIDKIIRIKFIDQMYQYLNELNNFTRVGLLSILGVIGFMPNFTSFYGVKLASYFGWCGIIALCSSVTKYYPTILYCVASGLFYATAEILARATALRGIESGFEINSKFAKPKISVESLGTFLFVGYFLFNVSIGAGSAYLGLKLITDNYMSESNKELHSVSVNNPIGFYERPGGESRGSSVEMCTSEASR